MDQRMTRPRRLTPIQHDRPGARRAARHERSVSWSDFRTAVRYDPSNPLLVAVPAISEKRAEHAWLGDAVTPHTRVGADVYRRTYQRGAVYWSERTGAHEVHGEVAARWLALGGESSFLGLPTTDEQPLIGVDGGFTHFEGGSVYWTARHGAAVVHGMTRDIWSLLGWERSVLGLPVADVVFEPDTHQFSGCFEHGTITWSPASGPDIVITALPASSGSTGEVGELGADEREALCRLTADFAPCA